MPDTAVSSLIAIFGESPLFHAACTFKNISSSTQIFSFFNQPRWVYVNNYSADFDELKKGYKILGA